MTDFAEKRWSDAELEAEFDRLFPQGFGGADVLRELAPEGVSFADIARHYYPDLSPEDIQACVQYANDVV